LKSKTWNTEFNVRYQLGKYTRMYCFGRFMFFYYYYYCFILLQTCSWSPTFPISEKSF